jgi:hypothetical protein
VEFPKNSQYTGSVMTGLLTKPSQPADFFVREKVALTQDKQQQCFLVGTVKRI